MRPLYTGVVPILVAVLVGCTPPYPTPKRTISQAGVIPSAPNPSTIIVGKSNREEVLSEFKGVDTGVSSPWFFWGRWKSSSVAVSAWTDSGIEQIPFWSGTNLLVEFDETGRVKKSETLSDKHIIRELQRILAEHPQSPTPVDASVDIGGMFYPSSLHPCYCIIKLSTTLMEISPKVGQRYVHKSPAGLRVSAQELTVAPYTLQFGESGTDRTDHIRATLHFSQKTDFGTDIPVSLKVNDLVSLLTAVQT